MREIKFRAWDKRNNKWIHKDLFFMSNAGFYADYRELEDGNSLFDYEFDLMQYTGLKDKNGKEIYEGDILSTDLSRPYLIVEFRNGAFMYQCHDNGQDYYDFMLPSIFRINQDKYSKVIGNIHENPELLES